MARTMTMTKARPAQKNAISLPVLTYSDSLPRDDLRDITGGLAHELNQNPKESGSSRPKSDGRSSKKPPPGGHATFDFQLTAPPEEVIPSSARSGRSPIGSHSIGVALGSPGMIDLDKPLPPPRFNVPNFTQESPQLNKSSKWKKIGGLFRAKNALTSPTNATRTTQKDQLKDGSNGNHQMGQKEDVTEEWPKIESDPKAVNASNTSPKRTRKFSFSGKKNPREKNGDGSPMLDVEIPDVQMERYSVMFSNVMTKNHKPSLLARRSKTLDNLHVPSAHDFLSAKLPPVPKRRATSPARTSFTLFPTPQPTKVLGVQNFSRGPSALIRSNTLPVESPSKPSMEHPRPFHNNNSLSSFESPIIANLFSERANTPQSSSPLTRKDEKPLPAIKPEPVTHSGSRTSSPQVPPKPRQSQPKPEKNIPTPKPKPVEQKNRPTQQRENKPCQIAEQSRPSRPTLTVKTKLEALPAPPPAPPAKDKSLSQPASPAVPAKDLPKELVPRISSAAIVASPLSMTSTPLKKLASPVITEREIKIPRPRINKKLPKIEVSTARSISVSKGKKQVLVPISARVEQNPNERFVDRRAMTPTITDAHGHRHVASQELQIESM
ncbi:uncharacterized protein N7483_012694 [Penicillium malachiteum]|uniref:uncharacterized protein n=1 Tax=Penicillium malachiteum TaxID=1324776 RepID=UPI002546AEE0|nr:uncharacterized protein N7483_012694 [Penicillium malachiteum]KAJ5715513.1 hypothetical protein N7483_012694 [Penicillium malachiteum]